MKRGLRAKAGMYDDACDAQQKDLHKWGGAPFPPHNGWQIADVISFDIMTIDTNEIVAHWENPDYKNKKGENNE